ncbi:uncharacterized [Tachysurus ichikawai]
MGRFDEGVGRDDDLRSRSSRDVVPQSCRTADGGAQTCSSLQIRSRRICFVNPSLFKEEFLITSQQRTPLVLALISDSRMKPGLKAGFLSLFHPEKNPPNTQKRSSSVLQCVGKKLGFELSRFGSPGDRFSPAFWLRSANPA